MINLIWKCYSYLGMIKVISVFVCNFYYDDMYLPKFEQFKNLIYKTIGQNMIKRNKDSIAILWGLEFHMF